MKAMRSFTEYSALNKFETVFSRLSSKIIFNFRMLGLEGLVWVSALIYFAFFVNPGKIHFTICPLANIGIDICPGCGLGNSISYIFRGEILNSISAHPLGLVAILIISYRIITLTQKNRRKNV